MELEALDQGVTSRVGVILKRTMPYQLHTGCYIQADGAVRHLHFATDKDLRFHELNLSYSTAAVGDEFVTPRRAEIICEFAAKVLEAHKKSPFRYGFELQTQLDQLTGEPEGEFPCFTCATFACAFLRAMGLTLLETDNWPIRPDDGQWQGQILGLFKDDAHIKKVRETVGGRPRVWPAEVAAGAIRHEGIALSQPAIKDLAEGIRAKLLAEDLESEE